MNDQVHLNSKSSNNMDIVTRFQKHASDFQKKNSIEYKYNYCNRLEFLWIDINNFFIIGRILFLKSTLICLKNIKIFLQ